MCFNKTEMQTKRYALWADPWEGAQGHSFCHRKKSGRPKCFLKVLKYSQSRLSYLALLSLG